MTVTQQFKLFGPDGSIIAQGACSDAALEPLPDSRERKAARFDMFCTEARADAAEQRQQEALASTAQMIADTVAHLTTRLDREEARRAERARRDAEEAEEAEQRRIQDELDRMPDPDDPDTYYHPTGDLHSLSPVAQDEGGTDPAYPQRLNQVPQPISISLNEE
jgi:hypothetical protein